MKKVLFACGENKKRSQMAEAIFNHFAKKAKAESAGAAPAEAVDPLTIEALSEIGIQAPNLYPKKFTPEMLQKADLIVSFGCLVKAQFPADKFQEWHIEDPRTLKQFRQVRDVLLEKIKMLIKTNNF